jgi:hypothetical protein
MSIPSNPSPLTPPSYPSTESQQPSSTVDPTGVWTRFLTTPQGSPTEDDVKKFLQGIMQMFSNIVKRDLAHAKENAEKLRKAAEGRDD